MRLIPFVFILSLFVFTPSFSHATTTLDLDRFLQQVKENNPAVRSSIITSQAAEARSTEGELLLSPAFFTNYTFASDSKLPQFSFLSYDKTLANTFSLGISKLTSFGLQAKLSYNLTHLRMIGIQSAGSSAPAAPGGAGGGGGASFINSIPTSYANASPSLEISQSLWSNAFGKSTRATQQLLKSQAMAISHISRFEARVALSQAEATFWRLATTRQVIRIQNEALDRAKKILEWNQKRAALHLGDQSDVLQAQAQVQRAELELLSSRNEEKAASRAFNAVRNLNSEDVAEELPAIDLDLMKQVQIPHRAELRDDVKAAFEQAQISRANSTVSLERNKPSLEVYANLALNGQSGAQAPSNINDSLGKSFSFTRPTYSVGVKMTTPLDVGTVRKVRDAYDQEQLAADLKYERKNFEQEQNWTELNKSLQDAKLRLELSEKLETIQKKKLLSEQERLHSGRSTTYQVLLFETDYLVSQLGRTRDQATILTILSQMKTFGETL